jgi:hypothetical protein
MYSPLPGIYNALNAKQLFFIHFMFHIISTPLAYAEVLVGAVDIPARAMETGGLCCIR